MQPSSQAVDRHHAEVPSLDLLRGTMPCLVFLAHAAIWTGCVKQLHDVFMAGGLAVDVFIFISGFLMLWHYLDREQREPWKEPTTWKRFWIRRFFRMAPLYWLTLTVVFGFHGSFNSWIEEFHRLYPPPWMDRLGDVPRVDSALSVGNLLAHYSFLFGFIPRYASNNPLPDWSIGLEMQFYLAFPFLAMAIRKFGWLCFSIMIVIVWRVCLDRIGLGLLSPAGPWGWFPMPSFLPLRIGVFLTGMLVAAALFRGSSGRLLGCYIAAAIALAGWHNKWLVVPVLAFVAWEWCDKRALLRAPWGWWVQTGRKLLRSKPVQFIADCSYGVYLWHIPVQLLAMRLLVDAGCFRDRAPLERFGMLCACALPAVYVVAWVTYRAVERPGIEWGKRILATKRIIGSTPNVHSPD